MDFGTFIGVGYILTEQEREELLHDIEETNPNRYNDIMDCMYPYDGDAHWFFGERICELDGWGQAMSLETIAALPGLVDDGSFGLKYGAMLVDCGVPIEEINTTWSKPNIYVVTWCFC